MKSLARAIAEKRTPKRGCSTSRLCWFLAVFMCALLSFSMVPPVLFSCTSIFSLVGPAWACYPARLLSPSIVQHLHDRAAPWRLSKLLLSYLYTNGIPVLTLHDGVQAHLQLAANRSQLSNFQLESHFGRYRHKYEYLVPFVSSPTFFTNFLQPFMGGARGP